jgi:hypothetical protein
MRLKSVGAANGLWINANMGNPDEGLREDLEVIVATSFPATLLS